MPLCDSAPEAKHVVRSPLRVAWITDFPFEWLPDVPEPFRSLPRGHPLSWQRVLLQELENEPSLDLHVCFLRKRIQKEYSLKRNGITFHARKLPPRVRAISLHWVDTMLLKPVLRKIQPDVVHAWGTEGGAALVARRVGLPYLVTIQGLLSWYRQLIPLTLRDHILARLELGNLARAPLVTTESKAAIEHLKKEIPQARVLQAEHAPDWLFHRLERKPQTDPVRFVFVGHIGYRKGVDLLLAALDRLKGSFEFELVMIGTLTPQTEDYIRTRASNELWKRIIVRENLRPEEVAQEVARATMMLFPTRADTSPNAAKEAVVAGVPVIGSALGGLLDYIFPGRNGFLFPWGDLEGFIAAIRQAMEHPLFRAGRVEPTTLAETRNYLSPKRMAERFLEAYQIVAADHKAPAEQTPVR